jgi:hypothetical protein
MDVDVARLKTELTAPLAEPEPRITAVDTRPGADEDAGIIWSESLPGLRDMPATVTTAVAVSVTNDSGTLFEDEVVACKLAASLLESIEVDDEARLVVCEPLAMLLASLPASRLEDLAAFGSIKLLYI